MLLTCLGQLALSCDVRSCLVAFEHTIQKPDNETVREQNERAHQTGAVPEMPNLYWDKRRRRKDHKELCPALLHVNADSFGKKNSRVKKRQKTCGPQRAPCEHGLQFVEEVGHSLAVFQQDFVRNPIRRRIHPAGPCVEKKQRNTQDQKQRAFGDFEDRDHLEIANPTRALQNRKLVRWILRSQVGHLATVAAGVSPAKLSCSQPTPPPLTLAGNNRTLPAADLQLVAVRVLEEKRVVAGTMAGAELGTFKRLPAGVAHQLCDPVHFLTCICPERNACAVRLMILSRSKPKNSDDLSPPAE